MAATLGWERVLPGGAAPGTPPTRAVSGLKHVP